VVSSKSVALTIECLSDSLEIIFDPNDLDEVRNDPAKFNKLYDEFLNKIQEIENSHGCTLSVEKQEVEEYTPPIQGQTLDLKKDILVNLIFVTVKLTAGKIDDPVARDILIVTANIVEVVYKEKSRKSEERAKAKIIKAGCPNIEQNFSGKEDVEQCVKNIKTLLDENNDEPVE
jgi:hypothetical protein